MMSRIVFREIRLLLPFIITIPTVHITQPPDFARSWSDALASTSVMVEQFALFSSNVGVPAQVDYSQGLTHVGWKVWFGKNGEANDDVLEDAMGERINASRSVCF